VAIDNLRLPPSRLLLLFSHLQEKNMMKSFSKLKDASISLVIFACLGVVNLSIVKAGPLKVGQIFEGKISLKGTSNRVIPLLPGKWEVIFEKDKFSHNTSSNYQWAALIKVPAQKGDYVQQTLFLTYWYDNNAEWGFNQPNRCYSDHRANVYHHYAESDHYSSGTPWTCLLVRASKASGSKTYAAGLKRVIQRGYRPPPYTGINVGFYAEGENTTYQFLQYNWYITDPKLIDKGKELKTGPFMPGRINEFPERKKYVDAIIAWAKTNKSKWQAILTGKDVGPLAPPNIPATSNPSAKTESKPVQLNAPVSSFATSVVLKLQKLKSIFDAGLITSEEYKDKKAEALKNF
jgi:hypothetical protein